jgi:hypothetical protein
VPPSWILAALAPRGYEVVAVFALAGTLERCVGPKSQDSTPRGACLLKDFFVSLSGLYHQL